MAPWAARPRQFGANLNASQKSLARGQELLAGTGSSQVQAIFTRIDLQPCRVAAWVNVGPLLMNPLPLIEIKKGLLELRPLKGGGLLIRGLHD